MIALEHATRVSWAMERNGVPIVHVVRVRNGSSETLRDATLSITLEPGFATPLLLPIPPLGPGAEVAFDKPDLRLDGHRLRAVGESDRATLRVAVQEGEVVLAEERRTVEVLAYNEWDRKLLPELLATFVLPNSEGVARLLAEAREQVRSRTGDPSLDGYQSRSEERVKALARGCFDALQRLGITYVEPPASFEPNGQKVRLPGQLLAHRMGTCLDLTVLLAAALEQCGLHALIVLTKSHAFPGVWLRKDWLPVAAIDDPGIPRKLAAAGELFWFDASAAAQGLPFEAAVAVAQAHLEQPDEFQQLIDVHAARLARILPLPIEQAAVAATPEAAAVPSEPSPPSAPAPPATVAAPARRTLTRIDRWKERLLDLSLRNRLLHHGESRTRMARCEGVGLRELEDRLQAGPLVLVPKVVVGGPDPRAPALVDARTSAEEARRWHREMLAAGQLPMGHDAADLGRRLLTMHREARRELEETGSSTLFLALGFLRWFESGSALEPRLAPLLLLPVELLRKGAQLRFELRLRDDEPRFNDTLIEKLEADFAIDLSELATLPLDEQGVDVAAVVQRVQAAVAMQPRFEVLPEAHLAFFSFSRFLLWRDLDEHRAALLAHGLVRNLVEGERDLPETSRADHPSTGATSAEPLSVTPIGFADPTELDRLSPPTRARLVLDADSSQQVAITAAVAGKSFVLQGPPGTGKSQTIANLIAECLAAGKRVLFVAEKQAALEVVARRLKRVGLGDLCLELHGTKVNKRDVVSELARVLELAAPRTQAGDDLALARAVEERAACLAAYVDRLHAATPLGMSFHQAIARRLALAEAPELRVKFEDPLAVDQAALQRRRARLGDLAEAARTASAQGPIAEHPFAACHPPEWTPLQQRATEAALVELEEAARVPVALLALEPVVAHLDSVLAKWEERARRRERSATRFEASLQQLERNEQVELCDRLRRHAGDFVLLRWWRLRGAFRRLAPFVRPELPDAATLAGWLDDPIRAQELDQELAAERPFVEALVAVDPPSSAAEQPSPDPFVAAAKLRPALVRFEAALAAVRARLAPDLAAAFGGDGLRAPPARVAAQAARWRSELPRLRDWTRHSQAEAGVQAEGLAACVEAVRSGAIALESLQAACERAFLDDWLAASIELHPELRRFDGSAHERVVEAYGRADHDWIASNGPAIAAAVRGSTVPPPSAVAVAESEVGILRRQALLKRRHLSIRRLFEVIPNLLPRLKPCLLMSPLAVAQFLPPSRRPFDLVVFDEASQIPTHEAVGAIARGTQVIVVGDSKQLPPTTFFATQAPDAAPGADAGDGQDGPDAGSELPAAEEVESILDECVASSLPQWMLRWHYRSRHEGLIAFSNRHYYGDALFTFPAAWTDGTRFGVSLVPVVGVFDRGRTRTNRAEAEAVARWIEAALTDPTRCGRSIGVVTFNAQQRDLVEDLLDELRRRRPELEPFFAESCPEPLFVKNLENVQGDERDVMLFSVTYGPDALGRNFMNFGPLNAQGGERRLNVAVTRAREQLVLFASLRHDQIDLARTRAPGVEHLKAFLRYAELGAPALGSVRAATPDAVQRPQTPERSLERDTFEAEVERRLTARGHRIDARVGVSSFRVDLAVRSPEPSDRWLLGLLTDGPGYRAAPSVRDRDRLRAAVLESLGWRLHRVWSAEFALDPARELARIETAIEAAKRAGAPAPLAGANAAVGSGAAGTLLAKERSPDPPPIVATTPDSSTTMTTMTPAGVTPWTPFDPAGGADRVAASPDPTAALAALVDEIVQLEGPLHLDALLRHLAAVRGVARLTQRVRQELQQLCVTGAVQQGRVELVGEFVWPKGQAREQVALRGPSADGALRDADEVPPEERAAAAAVILASAIALPLDDLARSAARLLGYGRATGKVVAAFAAGVQLLVEQGGAVVEGGTIRLP